METRKLKIGLFGFGCVGQGLYDVLNSSKGLTAEIVRICVKDRQKTRSLPADCFTFDKNEILNDPDINLVVELIDDADEAFEIVRQAMENGKDVVSANKKMIAEHYTELFELQQRHSVGLLYEGSSCGSIPIVRTLEEYYDVELLNSVSGIFNGTTNYILTKVCEEGKDYRQALAEAQQLGFAESNPFLDVYGHDARYKLCIIATHAFGVFQRPENVFVYGIPTLSVADMRYAREKNLKIKLLAHSFKTEKGLVSYVIPHLVKPDSLYAKVENEYNCVVVEATFTDRQFFQGKGAGSHPTGSAVLSDVAANRYEYRYEFKKLTQGDRPVPTQDHLLPVYLRYHSEEVLNRFRFEHIRERHANFVENVFYVLGQIRLSALAEIENLPELDVFMAVLPE